MTAATSSTDKILPPHGLRDALGKARAQGRLIVFTNGCFDVLHVGHVSYLEQARSLGDLLVVAVNSDASVKRQGKGDDRPINGEGDRMRVLAALSSVDFVTLFDEDTPAQLIAALEPDVLVKGGDWAPEKIVGGDLVRARGGRVLSLPFVSGYSTTSILAKVRAAPKG